MNKFVKYFLGLLTALLVLEIILSLHWRIQHDSPIMLYMSFLITKFGYLPYRDLFDMNMPGAYWAYSLVGHFSGYSDIGFRCVDLAILAAIMAMTWLWMKRLNSKIAWAGAVLFGLVYLAFGPNMSLQREYLALPLVIAGVWFASSRRLEGWAKHSLVGFLFGLSATIKPQTAIGLLPILFLEILEQRKNKRPSRLFFPILLPVVLGFVAPLLVAFAYLRATGAWGDFLDMTLNYWPLYTHLTGEHQTISGLDRLVYLWTKYREFDGYGVLLAPCVAGVFVSLFHSTLNTQQKGQVVLLSLLTLSYSIYPVFSGQFWHYHWLLFFYFLIQLSSLCFVDQPVSTTRGRQLFPRAIVLVAILMVISPSPDLRGQPFSPPKKGRVDEIASYLRANLNPGDKVQPLDWTGGAVHAMLISRAQLATPFIYDVQFYHHVSSPYIQSLRQRFIQSLKTARPRFIIQITSDKPWVGGADTSHSFEELQSILEKDYSPVLSGNGFIIYEVRE